MNDQISRVVDFRARLRHVLYFLDAQTPTGGRSWIRRANDELLDPPDAGLSDHNCD